MSWELQWGSSIKMLQSVHEKTGKMPKALKNRPLPRVDCTKYREAFDCCGHARHVNQAGLEGIPLGEIESYLNIRYIDDELEREAYMRMIQALDRVFLEFVNKK